MDIQTVACNICLRTKQEVNHWIVAIVRPGMEGIMFLPADAASEPRVEGYQYEDLCGQACAHTRFSQWLADLANIDYTKGEAS